MKKVVCFGLCFIIVLCSFVLSFASNTFVDDPQPTYLSASPLTVFQLPNGTGYRSLYTEVSYPVYVVVYGSDEDSAQTFKYVIFSQYPDTQVHLNNNGVDNILTLSSSYNGYFYQSGAFNYTTYDVLLPIYNVSSSTYVGNIIDAVDSSFFSVTFDLSTLVDGSVSWVSTMAQAVKSSGLLLFMVLIGFVGIGIGLFRRFTNG